MKRLLFAGAALFAAVVLPAGANAQDTIKIGVISPIPDSSPTRPRRSTTASSCI